MPKRRKLKTKPPSARSLAAKRMWERRRANADDMSYVSVPPKVIAAPVAQQPIRAQILDAAKALTISDRDKLYGDPRTNLQTQAEFQRIFWNAHLDGGKLGPDTAWGAAMNMLLMKLARIASAPNRTSQLHKDHYLDAINYLAIAFEVA